MTDVPDLGYGWNLIDLGVIISMMVLCIGFVVVGYDRRRSGLSNAPLAIEYDISSLEQ